MEEIWAEFSLYLPTGRLQPPARSGHAKAHSDGQVSFLPTPCPVQHSHLLRELAMRLLSLEAAYLRRLARISPQDPREKREESGEGADHKPAG